MNHYRRGGRFPWRGGWFPPREGWFPWRGGRSPWRGGWFPWRPPRAVASRDIHPEALAALTLFQQAAEADQVTRALLDQVASDLHNAHHAPEVG